MQGRALRSLYEIEVMHEALIMGGVDIDNDTLSVVDMPEMRHLMDKETCFCRDIENSVGCDSHGNSKDFVYRGFMGYFVRFLLNISAIVRYTGTIEYRYELMKYGM